jgi:hypothetical protein
MNIGALPELLISWLKTQGIELPQAGKGQTTPFQPGQDYTGKVMENLPNGRSLVQVGKELLDMQLPQQPKAGDSVRLTFLTATNRPTFLLQPAPTSNAQPVRLSEAVQQVNALVRFAQATAPAAATPAGGAAQVASAQAAIPMQASAPGTASPSSSGAPTSPPSATATISQGASQAALAANPVKAASTTAQPTVQATVQAAVAQAGMQAAAKPILPNPAVMLVAQAAAPATAPGLAANPALPALAMAGQAVDAMRAAMAPNTALTTQGVVSQTSPGVQVLSQMLRKTLAESGMFYENHLGRWVRGQVPLEAIQREPQAILREAQGQLLKLQNLEGMPEEAARLAGRQLMMLEGGPFVWQGMAWPGQWMQWLVEERPGNGHNPEDELPRWRTQLRLTLPRLGEVRAELGVGALGLQINLMAPNAETLEEMKAALPDLGQRLQAAELNLIKLNVELADA